MKTEKQLFEVEIYGKADVKATVQVMAKNEDEAISLADKEAKRNYRNLEWKPEQSTLNRSIDRYQIEAGDPI